MVIMASEYKRLKRSRDDSMIAGVCGGLGEYFAIDPTVIRLAAVVVGFMNPAGAVMAYLLMMIVVPLSPLAELAEE
jgi:phage shock protein C